MTRVITWQHGIAAAIAVLTAVGIALALGKQGLLLGNQEGDAAAVRIFAQAIDDYMQLRDGIEDVVPAFAVSDDPRTIHEAVHARAVAIRAARPNARTGAIFCDEIGATFRRLIRSTLSDRGYRIVDLLEENADDVPPGTPAPRVHQAFPSEFGNAMWPSLLAAMPLLPHPLQYRFAGRDLVLLDVDANLVIDILRDALSSEST
jgi:hypothetical protein